MSQVFKSNITHIGVMVKRDLIHLSRNSESMVMTIFLPIMVTLVFVYVFGGALAQTGDRTEYLRFVLPGILVMSPAFGAYMTGVGVNNDMSKGIIDRFRTMHINQSSVLVGHITASLLRNLIGAIIVVVFAVLIGFRTDVPLTNWIALTGMGLLYFLMITSLSLMVGLLCSSVESVGGILMFVQFAPYISSAFVPTETMPEVLRYFANNQPFTVITNSFRGFMLGIDTGSNWIVAVIWCVLITAVCLVISKYAYDGKTS